jgi:hypothetical protein
MKKIGGIEKGGELWERENVEGRYKLDEDDVCAYRLVFAL